MKKKWLWSLPAIAPFVLTMVVLQSCGGEGGPVGTTGSSITKEFMALMTDEQKSATYIGAGACADSDCHGGRGRVEEEHIYTTWLETKHGQNDVTCERCHGPGSKHAADPETVGLILKLPESSSAVVCAQCHGSKYDEWKESGHAEVVASPVTAAASQQRNSQCIVCHSGLMRNQYTENGVSPSALSDGQIAEVRDRTINTVPHTATCVTCHNPHKQTGKLSVEGEEVQLRHPVSNDVTTPIEPGTTASSFVNFDHGCAECHNGRGVDGADVKLAASTSRPSMHDSNQMNMLKGFGASELPSAPVLRQTAHASVEGQCAKCHMGEGRHSFGASYDTGCVPCHTASDAAARLSTLKIEIVNALFALRTKMETYATAQFGNAALWDYTALITGGLTPPDQATVPVGLKRARHNYYFVLRDGSLGVHNAAYTRYMIGSGSANMDVVLAPGALSPRSSLSYEAKLRILMSDVARARQADMDGG